MMPRRYVKKICAVKTRKVAQVEAAKACPLSSPKKGPTASTTTTKSSSEKKSRGRKKKQPLSSAETIATSISSAVQKKVKQISRINKPLRVDPIHKQSEIFDSNDSLRSGYWEDTFDRLLDEKTPLRNQNVLKKSIDAQHNRDSTFEVEVKVVKLSDREVKVFGPPKKKMQALDKMHPPIADWRKRRKRAASTVSASISTPIRTVTRCNSLDCTISPIAHVTEFADLTKYYDSQGKPKFTVDIMEQRRLEDNTAWYETSSQRSRSEHRRTSSSKRRNSPLPELCQSLEKVSIADEDDGLQSTSTATAEPIIAAAASDNSQWLSLYADRRTSLLSDGTSMVSALDFLGFDENVFEQQLNLRAGIFETAMPFDEIVDSHLVNQALNNAGIDETTNRTVVTEDNDVNDISQVGNGIENDEVEDEENQLFGDSLSLIKDCSVVLERIDEVLIEALRASQTASSVGLKRKITVSRQETCTGVNEVIRHVRDVEDDRCNPDGKEFSSSGHAKSDDIQENNALHNVGEDDDAPLSISTSIDTQPADIDDLIDTVQTDDSRLSARRIQAKILTVSQENLKRFRLKRRRLSVSRLIRKVQHKEQENPTQLFEPVENLPEDSLPVTNEIVERSEEECTSVDLAGVTKPYSIVEEIECSQQLFQPRARRRKSKRTRKKELLPNTEVTEIVYFSPMKNTMRQRKIRLKRQVMSEEGADTGSEGMMETADFEAVETEVDLVCFEQEPENVESNLEEIPRITLTDKTTEHEIEAEAVSNAIPSSPENSTGKITNRQQKSNKKATKSVLFKNVDQQIKLYASRAQNAEKNKTHNRYESNVERLEINTKDQNKPISGYSYPENVKQTTKGKKGEKNFAASLSYEENINCKTQHNRQSQNFEYSIEIANSKVKKDKIRRNIRKLHNTECEQSSKTNSKIQICDQEKQSIVSETLTVSTDFMPAYPSLIMGESAEGTNNVYLSANTIPLDGRLKRQAETKKMLERVGEKTISKKLSRLSKRKGKNSRKISVTETKRYDPKENSIPSCILLESEPVAMNIDSEAISEVAFSKSFHNGSNFVTKRKPSKEISNKSKPEVLSEKNAQDILTCSATEEEKVEAKEKTKMPIKKRKNRLGLKKRTKVNLLDKELSIAVQSIEAIPSLNATQSAAAKNPIIDQLQESRVLSVRIKRLKYEDIPLGIKATQFLIDTENSTSRDLVQNATEVAIMDRKQNEGSEKNSSANELSAGFVKPKNKRVRKRKFDNTSVELQPQNGLFQTTIGAKEINENITKNKSVLKAKTSLEKLKTSGDAIAKTLTKRKLNEAKGYDSENTVKKLLPTKRTIRMKKLNSINLTKDSEMSILENSFSDSLIEETHEIVSVPTSSRKRNRRTRKTEFEKVIQSVQSEPVFKLPVPANISTNDTPKSDRINFVTLRKSKSINPPKKSRQSTRQMARQITVINEQKSDMEMLPKSYESIGTATTSVVSNENKIEISDDEPEVLMVIHTNQLSRNNTAQKLTAVKDASTTLNGESGLTIVIDSDSEYSVVIALDTSEKSTTEIERKRTTSLNSIGEIVTDNQSQKSISVDLTNNQKLNETYGLETTRINSSTLIANNQTLANKYDQQIINVDDSIDAVNGIGQIAEKSTENPSNLNLHYGECSSQHNVSSFIVKSPPKVVRSLDKHRLVKNTTRNKKASISDLLCGTIAEESELSITAGSDKTIIMEPIVLAPGKWRRSLNAWKKNHSILVIEKNEGNKTIIKNSPSFGRVVRTEKKITLPELRKNHFCLSLDKIEEKTKASEIILGNDEKNADSKPKSIDPSIRILTVDDIDSSRKQILDDTDASITAANLERGVVVDNGNPHQNEEEIALRRHSVEKRMTKSIEKNTTLKSCEQNSTTGGRKRISTLLLEPTDDEAPNIHQSTISLLEQNRERNLPRSLFITSSSSISYNRDRSCIIEAEQQEHPEEEQSGDKFNESSREKRRIYQQQLSAPLYRQQQSSLLPPRRRRTSVLVPSHDFIKSVLQQSLLQQHSEGVETIFSDLVRISALEAGLLDQTELDARSIVLRRCEQSEPLDFETVYSKAALRQCRKIGEGVYGEVFLNKTASGEAVVLKIIPIEGSIEVNSEPQKRFDQILSEIVIALELSRLKNDKQHMTSGFVDVKKVRCVQGHYPQHLIDLWELYNENCNSENDHPEIFPEDQLYIVLELANGGKDLEAFEFQHALQSHSAFMQVAITLAVAEKKFQFEHRDLHWGNILLAQTDLPEIIYKLDGKELKIKTHGVKATIIDYTLSRMSFEGACLYNDLSNDDELFSSVGDYQFEIYRHMKQQLNNDWECYEPHTNILWLHYAIDKMIDGARYRCRKSNKHRSAIDDMIQLRDELLDYKSACDYVKCLE